MKEIKPYLEDIELTLLDNVIKPFARFRLLLKANGMDLLCDGSWFQIALTNNERSVSTEAPKATASGLDSKATVISQPRGKKLSVGTTGEWHIELQAPMEEGEYTLHVITDAVDSAHSYDSILIVVENRSGGMSEKTYTKHGILLITSLGFLLSLLFVFISFEIDPFYRFWIKYLNAPKVITAERVQRPNNITEETIAQMQLGASEANQTLRGAEKSDNHQQSENEKTKLVIDNLLDQSFNHPVVSMRQKAWEKLSRYIDSHNNIDRQVILNVSRQRTNYKKQTESWLISKENSNELYKRLQLLTSVEDDVNAQLWIGHYYAIQEFADSDLGKAWQWFQRAANKGNAEAQQLVDVLETRADQMLKSTDINLRNRGYKITEAVANAGGVNAQLWMGYRYETGDGVAKNLDIAANWYLKATSQGNEDAIQKLSQILSLIANHKKVKENNFKRR